MATLHPGAPEAESSSLGKETRKSLGVLHSLGAKAHADAQESLQGGRGEPINFFLLSLSDITSYPGKSPFIPINCRTTTSELCRVCGSGCMHSCSFPTHGRRALNPARRSPLAPPLRQSEARLRLRPRSRNHGNPQDVMPV